MFKKSLYFFLLLCLFSFIGCGGGNDSTPASSTSTPTSGQTTIKTTIQFNNDTSTFNPAPGYNGNFAPNYATSAAVRLILDNGTTITMTSDGNGEYSCNVAGLSNYNGFVIEATRGNLVLRNLFNNILNANDSSTFDCGTTNEKTTAAVEIIRSAIGVLNSQPIDVSSTTNLLNGLKNVQVKVDVNDIKEKVTNGDTKYIQTVRTIQTILNSADTSSTGTNVIDRWRSGDTVGLNLTSDSSFTKVVEQVLRTDPDSQAMVYSSDKENAKYSFQKVLEGFLTKNTNLASQYLSTTKTLWGGKTYASVLTGWQSEWSQTNPSFSGEVIVRQIGNDTFAGYLVGIWEDRYITTNVLRSYEKDYDNNENPIYIIREGSNWKCVGDLQKFDVWYNLYNNSGYSLSDYDSRVYQYTNNTSFWCYIEEATTDNPIDSAYIVIKRGVQTIATAYMIKNAVDDDSNEWQIDWQRQQQINASLLNVGDVIYFYARINQTWQVVTRTIQGLPVNGCYITSSSTSLTSDTIIYATSSFTVNWNSIVNAIGIDNICELRVSVDDMQTNSSDRSIVRCPLQNFNLTTATIPVASLIVGHKYAIRIHYDLKNRTQYTYEKHFVFGGTR